MGISRLIHDGTSTGTNNYRLGSDTTSKIDFVGDGSNQISLKKLEIRVRGSQLMRINLVRMLECL